MDILGGWIALTNVQVCGTPDVFHATSLASRSDCVGEQETPVHDVNGNSRLHKYRHVCACVSRQTDSHVGEALCVRKHIPIGVINTTCSTHIHSYPYRYSRRNSNHYGTTHLVIQPRKLKPSLQILSIYTYSLIV